MFDVGPYYITDLVNPLVPVASVAGMTSKVCDTRTITREPQRGATIPVKVATYVAGTLHSSPVLWCPWP